MNTLEQLLAEPIAVCGSRMACARALAALEGLRPAPAPAVAASGGRLLSRLHRILGLGPASAGNDTRRWGAWAAAPLVLAVLLAAGAVFHGCGRETHTAESRKTIGPAATRPTTQPAAGGDETSWGKPVDGLRCGWVRLKDAAIPPGARTADRIYSTALSRRVLLGAAPDGTVKQQFEDFYESPQLKKVKLAVRAGTEGRILKVRDQACYVEVPAARVLGKVAAKAPAGGWLSLARKRTVFDVIGVLLANRKRSRVTVNLDCKEKRIVSGGPLEVSAAFTNTSKTIKTVHFGPLYLRDSSRAAPLPDLGGPGGKRIVAVTRNIEPGKTITITTELLPKLPPAAVGGSYRLYAIYSIREGPNGPRPVRMVSDPVTLSVGATEPLDLDKIAKMLAKAAGGTWRTKTNALHGTIPMNAVFDTLCVVFPFPYDEAGKAKVLSFTAPRARGFRVLGSTEQCTVLADLRLPDPPEKAAAFFTAVSKTLKLRPPKLTLKALRRSRQLKANINSFNLQVWYHGPKDKSYYRLLLTAAPIERKERPFEMIRFLDARQAERIIDHLAAEGFLSRAVEVGEKANVAYDGPAYFMTVPRGTSRFEATLGWGPEMLARLDALREVLDGDAAKAMGDLLKRLAAQNLEWKWKKHTLPAGPRLLGKILSLRQVIRGGYTFIAICEALNEPQAVSDATGAYQKFKVHAFLGGTGPAVKTFNLNYHYYAHASPPERPVRKGEKVIWIARDRADPYKGVKVLAYTPENHKAVDEALMFERYAGKAVNGLKLTLRAAKATTAMRPDGRSAEPVPLAFTFANVGDKPIKLETSDHLWPRLALHVTGPDGKSVRITELMLERIGPTKVTYSVLKAGQSVTYSRRFAGDYFNYKTHEFLKPGAYRIWASYLSAVAVSNEIILTVTAAPAAQPPATAEAALRAKVRALLADLESDDRRVRRRASVALGKLGPESAAAVPDLAAALGGKDRHARISALLMLTRIGPAARDAVGALIKALKDEDRGVRYSAAEALGAIGPAAKAAVPMLVLALKDADSDVQYHARKALGKIGPPAGEAVPALIRAVKDKDSRVRAAAATALGQIGPAAETAVPALVEALKDTDYQALLKIGLAAVPHLIQALKTGQRPLRRRAAEVLGKMGPAAKAAVPELIRTLKEEKGGLRAAAAKALGGIGPVTKGVIPALIQALRDGPSYEPGSGSIRPVRSGADDVLLKMQDQAVPALIRVVNDPADEARVRREAVRLLGWIGPAAKAAVPTLLKTLDSTDPSMRQQVVDSLGRIGPVTKEVVPALLKALADEENGVRYHAAEALGSIRPVDKAVIPSLIKAAKDGYPTVRKYAIRSLGKIDPTAKGVLPVLLAALKDPAGNVRRTAAEIVGRLAPAGKQAMPIFIDLLKDEDWKVRTAAAEALVSLGPAPKTAVLPLAKATTDDSGSVAHAAAMALAKMGPAAGQAVPVLLGALGDKSPWVRSHAAKALGALGPVAKQAETPLTQALKDEDVHVRKAASEALKRIRAGKPKAIGFQPIPAKSVAYVDASWVTIYLVADDAVLRLMIPLGKVLIKGNSVVAVALNKGEASLFRGKDAWRYVLPRGTQPPLAPGIKRESAVSGKFTCIDIPARKTWPYHGKTRITVRDIQLVFPSGRIAADAPLTFILRPFPPGAAVPESGAAAVGAAKEDAPPRAEVPGGARQGADKLKALERPPTESKIGSGLQAG